MAYFKWKGVDLHGNECSGKLFATSEKNLCNQLLEREIALITYKPSRQWFSFRPITIDEKINFFRQLAVLLDAGVLLPDALHVLSSLLKNVSLKEIVLSLKKHVLSGESLSKALEQYPGIFGSLMVRMVRVGQESGKLSSALDRLSSYLESTQSFRKKLKSAALIPVVTFGFFLLITSVIFVWIVPRFESLFSSMKKELPFATKTILQTSRFLRSWYLLVFIAGIILLSIFVHWYSKTTKGKNILDKFVLHIPWLGTLSKQKTVVYVLYSLSMLLNSGIRLVQAITISNKSVINSVLQKQLTLLQQEITAGVSLSQAMQKLNNTLFDHDIIAIAHIGQESGQLGNMLEKGAKLYQEKVNKSITFFTTIFQPLLMIILGLMILLLIFAIYLPVFNLAHIV